MSEGKQIHMFDGLSDKEIAAIAKDELAKKEDLPKEKLVVLEAAKLWDVPEHMMIAFLDPRSGRVTPYITKMGMLWKLRQFGYHAVQTEVEPDPERKDGYIATCEIYPKLQPEDYKLLLEVAKAKDPTELRRVMEDLQRPTVHHATANKENVKMRTMHVHLFEMAETRATLRAARVYCGMGLAVEEKEDEA